MKEDDLVVDIGTGSGLLAIMAALAGAQHVFAIEGDPSLERAARKVIAANGKAETVTVVGRHSMQVKVGFGSDVPTGADVIVTEIFDRCRLSSLSRDLLSCLVTATKAELTPQLVVGRGHGACDARRCRTLSPSSTRARGARGRSDLGCVG